MVSLMSACIARLCLGKSMFKTGVLSLLIKCLLYKHWGLRMGSQHPCKSGVWWHMPLTPVLTARQLLSLMGHQSYSIQHDSDSLERFFLKTKREKKGVEEDIPKSISGLHMGIHRLMHLHTCPHAQCLNS